MKSQAVREKNLVVLKLKIIINKKKVNTVMAREMALGEEKIYR